MPPLVGELCNSKLAVEGVDWCKISVNGKSRYVCMGKKCGATQHGYSEIHSLNRHFKLLHEDPIFVPSCGDGGLGDVTTGQPCGAGVLDKRKSTIPPAKDNGCLQAPDGAPWQKLRKRPHIGDERRQLHRKKQVPNAGDREPLKNTGEDLAELDGMRSKEKGGLRGVGSTAMNSKDKGNAGETGKGAALLDIARAIDLPTYGVSNVSFVTKMQASPGKSCTTFVAKWFPANAAPDNLDMHAENQGKGVATLPIGGLRATFPIVGSTSQVVVSTSPKEKGAELSARLKFGDFLQSVKEMRPDCLDWTDVAMDGFQGGEGGVPLVDYSDLDVN